MSQKDKLIKKLKRLPKDFTFDEAATLLKYFEFVCSDKGKTSGSRVMFYREGFPPVLMHKPHPQKELKTYQLKQLLEYLTQEGLL